MQPASFQLPRPKRPLSGWAWVLLLHALLFWAVHVGLTRDVVKKMPTVVQALLLTETPRETPPPPAVVTKPQDKPQDKAGDKPKAVLPKKGGTK